MKAEYIAVLNRNNSYNNKPTSSGGDGTYKYEAVPTADRELKECRSLIDVGLESQAAWEEHLRSFKKKNKRRLIIIVIGAISIFVFFYLATA
jgi:hypothetical protein